MNNLTRPNYFLGLKIKNADIQSGLKLVQTDILNRFAPLNRSKIQAEKFHLTVFVMTLDESKGDLEKVKQLLPMIRDEMLKVYKVDTLPPRVEVHGIGSFNDRVLWAGIKDGEQSDQLTQFVKFTTQLFQKNGINVEDRWSPHITLFKGKFSQDFKNAVSYTQRVETNYTNKAFGIQEFDSMELMKIGSTDKVTGYYNILSSVSLK
ncbi:hypothetical protein DLAC_10593 [Tieghemostelium lacteum]|uniref:A-kinase anchor protein 7-like phosphoesterase domain-containing protein n=1 Tax=Tieghemostelium lacteum TaxID=361077 RepID=A0A151Z4B3_TIELA|nr:hypothetical protein DLAC_10593 [Tieghemostelium lacteum]|eukprot:KYQ88796.1 hypothetical protein DLAC_10593 [Tieghemostelium lacteum]